MPCFTRRGTETVRHQRCERTLHDGLVRHIEARSCVVLNAPGIRDRRFCRGQQTTYLNGRRLMRLQPSNALQVFQGHVRHPSDRFLALALRVVNKAPYQRASF